MAGKKTEIYTHKAAQKTENRHHALMHNAETVAHSLPEVSVALSGCHIHIHNFPLTAEIKHISARFGMLLPTAVTLSWTPNSTMWIFLDHIIIYFNLNVSTFCAECFSLYLVLSVSVSVSVSVTLLFFNHITSRTHLHRVLWCWYLLSSLLFWITICTAFTQHLNAVAVWIIEQENWCIWNEPKTHRTLRSQNIILHFFRISFTSTWFTIVKIVKCLRKSKHSK